MSVLTVTEIRTLALERLQANVDVDPPFDDTQILGHINDAYADVWEIWGGALKRVAGATLWTPQPAVDLGGTFTSVLTDIDDVREVFYSITPGSVGDVVAGDTVLEPTTYSTIMRIRENQGMFGSYARPMLYAIGPGFSTVPADANKLQLDVWPGKIGANFPTHYVPQFTLLDYVTVTVPSVNDLASRDIGLLAAVRMGPLSGRAELVPGIMADVSQRTQEGIARKLAMVSGGKTQ